MLVLIHGNDDIAVGVGDCQVGVPYDVIRSGTGELDGFVVFGYQIRPGSERKNLRGAAGLPGVDRNGGGRGSGGGVIRVRSGGGGAALVGDNDGRYYVGGSRNGNRSRYPHHLRSVVFSEAVQSLIGVVGKTERRRPVVNRNLRRGRHRGGSQGGRPGQIHFLLGRRLVYVVRHGRNVETIGAAGLSVVDADRQLSVGGQVGPVITRGRRPRPAQDGPAAGRRRHRNRRVRRYRSRKGGRYRHLLSAGMLPNSLRADRQRKLVIIVVNHQLAGCVFQTGGGTGGRT